jgi:hypothetical protein
MALLVAWGDETAEAARSVVNPRPDITAALTSLENAAQEALPAEVPALLGELERVKGTLWARLMTTPTGRAGPDQLLTADEAATRLAVTKDWLRRRPDLPFVVKLSDGVVRYSLRRLDVFIAQHYQS